MTTTWSLEIIAVVMGWVSSKGAAGTQEARLNSDFECQFRHESLTDRGRQRSKDGSPRSLTEIIVAVRAGVLASENFQKVVVREIGAFTEFDDVHGGFAAVERAEAVEIGG